MVKSAFVPKSPASPKVALNLLLGLILGFGLGLGLAILRQIFDNTIKNEGDLDGSPLMAVIGFDKSAAKKPLITQISRYASRTEAFRQLRTNLQYSRTENAPRVIAITSALPEEGKTTSSINLAISLANSGFQIALIEADMRRSRFSSYLHLKEVSNDIGLSELLSSQVSENLKTTLNDFIQHSGIEGLDIISSGKTPANPAELLDSDVFTKMIESLRSRYDFVIIDCPPALPVADASIIAPRTDGVVIIVKADQTRKVQFLGVRDAITAVGGEILGVVLNMVPSSRSYYDYGFKYGYGYGYQKKYGSYSGEIADNEDRPYAPRNSS